MKKHDLDLRDEIAIQALIVVRHVSAKSPEILAKETARRAYLIADEMLAHAGRQRDEIAEANRRAEKAEMAADMLRNMNEDGQFAPRVALEQLWGMLKVRDQTAAVQRINDLLGAH